MNGLHVLNTKGAARRLGCTETWIHKLVATGKLKAYVYDDKGMLVEHQPDVKRQGQGLYFLMDDVDNYQSKIKQRTKGKKNESP